MNTHDQRRGDDESGRGTETSTETHGSGRSDRSGGRSLSRRSFVRASAGVGIGALALGGVTTTAAQSIVEEGCSEGDVIQVGDGNWHLLNNQWGMPDSQQCIWLRDDGSYGYNFSAVGDGINYPEAFCGGRPWGSDSGIPELPGRRGDIDEFVLEWDVDINISGGAWNLAEEWWLLDGQPQSTNPPITHEIMLVLDWGGGHDHYMEEPNVWTDRFGNTIDYWADYSESGGGTGDDFHIFRINGGASSGRVDLKAVIDFMSQRHGVSDNLTLTGVEVGDEYWAGASGEVVFNQLDLTINGTTYESGSGGSTPDGIELDGYTARDLNGDGRYRDVNGNGSNDFQDVVAFFEEMNSSGVQSNVSAFDFNGNGGIDFADVTALFERV